MTRLLLLTSLLLVAGSGPARAGRVDVTDFLAPKPAVGDYRVYVTSWNGNIRERRYDVTAVEERAKGWRVEWKHDGSSYSSEVVRPGVKVRRATVDDSPVPGCRIALDYEVRGCPLRLPAGDARTFSRRFVDVSSFLFVQLQNRRGRYRLGFEPVVTPYASHDSAAVITSDVRVFVAPARLLGSFRHAEQVGPWALDLVSTRRSWYVEGVGIVGLRVTYGPDTPPEELWLREGLVEGVPYP